MFQFFPNIGEQIVAKIEGTLDTALAHKWRYHGRGGERDASRDSDVRGTTKRASLILSELAKPEDLKATAKLASSRDSAIAVA